MKNRFLLLAALCLMFSCTSEQENGTVGGTAKNAVSSSEAAFEPGTTIVRFSDDFVAMAEEDFNQGKLATRSMELNQALDELGIKSIRRLFPDAGEFEARTRKEGLHKWYVVEYSYNVPVTRAALELESVPGIEYVENHRKLKTCAFNDPSFSKQWQYSNSKVAGTDINVLPVWNYYTTGSSNVVVAVVDGGIDQSHQDLAADCSSSNYNFVDNNTNIVAHSHGTHVAGIIGAVNNNSLGVCGTAGGNAAAGIKGVTLMSCQIFETVTKDGKESDKGGDSASAIKWGADHGAVICQNSWGYDYDEDGDGALAGKELDNALAATIEASDKAAVDYFIKYAGCDKDGNQLASSPMKGGVVIFAAGNEGIKNGAPANYEPIIAVGATNSDGVRASYSNYGDFVDIAAPGSSIYSTIPNNAYGAMSGTSMACPFVSGVAALVVSYCGGQGFTNDKLKQKLIGGSNKTVLPSSYQIGGLVDALGALLYGNDSAPYAVSDLNAKVVSNALDLSWTVPRDSTGHPAYGFVVIYGKDKTAVEKAGPSTGADVSRKIVTPALGVGETVSYSLSDLDFSTDYFVKVVAFSYLKSYADPSSVLQKKTGENQPPVISSDYVKTSLKAYETLTVNVSVSDPDGHPFTTVYTQGSAADVFSTSSSGAMQITITAKNADPGTYSAVLKATDSYGATSSFTFTYTILENNPPVKVKDVDNMFFTATNTEFTMNMSDYFNDPDGEQLRYVVAYSDNSVVYLNPKDNSLIGTVLKYGRTTVTVTAYDAKNKSAELSFIVLARDASIEYQTYPNPVTTVLNIATGSELVDTYVKIVSQTGSSVYEGTLKASAFVPAQVDMSSCAPGTYSATIRFGSKEFRQTIAKK